MNDLDLINIYMNMHLDCRISSLCSDIWKCYFIYMHIYTNIYLKNSAS